MVCLFRCSSPSHHKLITAHLQTEGQIYKKDKESPYHYFDKGFSLTYAYTFSSVSQIPKEIFKLPFLHLNSSINCFLLAFFLMLTL